MSKLYKLRIYPKDSDVYEKDGKYTALPDTHTLKECEEIIDSLSDPNNHYLGGWVGRHTEIIAVDEQGNRYFAPRDGFDWMDVTKVGEI